jgi:hypothetical protein
VGLVAEAAVVDSVDLEVVALAAAAQVVVGSTTINPSNYKQLYG